MEQPPPPVVGSIPRRKKSTTIPPVMKKPTGGVRIASLPSSKLPSKSLKQPQEISAERVKELKKIVVNIPENRDISIIIQEWEDIVGQASILCPHFAAGGIDAEVWEQVRRHLMMVDYGKKLKKSSTARDALSSTPFPGPFPTLQKFEMTTSLQPIVAEADLRTTHYDTDLGRLLVLSSSKLPLVAKVTQPYSSPGCHIVIGKDELLLMHYAITAHRVRAVDEYDGKEVWLPIHAQQLYKRFPLGE